MDNETRIIESSKQIVEHNEHVNRKILDVVFQTAGVAVRLVDVMSVLHYDNAILRGMVTNTSSKTLDLNQKVDELVAFTDALSDSLKSLENDFTE